MNQALNNRSTQESRQIEYEKIQKIIQSNEELAANSILNKNRSGTPPKSNGEASRKKSASILSNQGKTAQNAVVSLHLDVNDQTSR